MRSSTTMPRLTSRPGVLGERRVRADADGHDHEIGVQHAAVVELDALDLAVAEDGLGLGLGEDLDAALLECAFFSR